MGGKLSDSRGQRDLNYREHAVRIVRQARQGESVQPRKIVAEKAIECLFVIRKQLFYKAFIVQVDSHYSSIAFA